MPNKRNRKDSTSSQGGSSPGSTGSSAVEELSDSCPINKTCAYANCSLQEELDGHAWVKVQCSNESCDLQFMHQECFKVLEDHAACLLKSQGRTRNWSDKQRRQHLWTNKGYNLAMKACICKCRNGFTKKDVDYIANNQVGDQQGDAKKKNRKKNKDLPVLCNGKASTIAPFQRSKSKPIPSSSQHARIRTNSTGSAISLDQGYISSSPCTAGPEYAAAAMLSPVMQAAAAAAPWRVNPSVILQRNAAVAAAAANHASSTSPLPELTDVSEKSGNNVGGGGEDSLVPSYGASSHVFTPSTGSAHLSLGNGNSPPFSPDQRAWFYSGRTSSQLLPVKESVISDDYNSGQQFQQQQQQSPIFNALPELSAEFERCFQLHGGDHQQVGGGSKAIAVPPQSSSGGGGYHYMASPSTTGIAKELKMQEEREMEKKMEGKGVRSKATVGASSRSAKAHTEIKLVPLRHTVFKPRFDFSTFQNVLPRQKVNPYHIKMEGEGYGSDDLRNFILSALSLASCSQMNCVVCGIGMPVYDHFPLVDGTMFLSPERNERYTKRGVKIAVDGKNEYVHAACLRCLEGIHNIICRLCDQRWFGSHHQLGTLYMYDIFAADPCCQARLTCKNCGAVLVDHRTGLKNYSDYSRKRQCPCCMVVDHHFVRPISSHYTLVGVIFS